IATPADSAASADDFFVPPEGIGVADVASTGRVTVGGSGVTASIPSYKAALLVFDGTVGQQVTLGYSNISVSLLASDMTVYRPEGGLLSSQPVGFFGGDTHIASLPVTGTYELLIKPQGSYSGNITVTLSQDLSVGPLVVGGSSVTANITRPGQRARTTFSGTAGQRLSLHSSSASFVQLTLTVTKPDGSTFVTGGFVATDGTVNWDPLPTTGTYVIQIDPSSNYTGGLTLTLSEEVTGTIVPGGSAVTVSISRAGQRARLTFTGTSGQRLSLKTTGVTIGQAAVSILRPDS